MTAAESRYQTLRSHLHYLRLEATAEALPQELERARKEKLSHTAFLERLLAIEVEVKFPRFSGHPSAWRESSRQARKEMRDAPEVSEAVPAGVPA